MNNEKLKSNPENSSKEFSKEIYNMLFSQEAMEGILAEKINPGANIIIGFANNTSETKEERIDVFCELYSNTILKIAKYFDDPELKNIIKPESGPDGKPISPEEIMARRLVKITLIDKIHSYQNLSIDAIKREKKLTEEQKEIIKKQFDHIPLGHESDREYIEDSFGPFKKVEDNTYANNNTEKHESQLRDIKLHIDIAQMALLKTNPPKELFSKRP